MVNQYKTVAHDAQIELVIQKSKFIGSCFFVETEAHAQTILEQTRKRYWDASHNCYAFVIGETGDLARFSDDGEPSSTAGMPMLEAIRQKQLTNVLVIATRYFGGILLGAGGLVRAYAKTTAESTAAAGEITMQRAALYDCCIAYNIWGRLENRIKAADYMIHEICFEESIHLKIYVPVEEKYSFEKNIVNWSDGATRPEYLQEDFWLWDKD